MDDQQRLRGNQDDWPKDRDGKTFLLRAILEVGAAVFPDSWTGQEFWTAPSLGFGEQYVHTFSDGKRALKIPRSHEDKVNQITYLLLGKDLAGAQHVTEKERAAAFELSEQGRMDFFEILSRCDGAMNILVDALADGKISSFLRPVQGGSFSNALNPDLWNSEVVVDTRFCYGQMHMNNPFGRGLAGDGYQYIYLEEIELQRFLESISAASQEGVKRIELTPDQKQKLSNCFTALYEANPEMTNEEHLNAAKKQLQFAAALTNNMPDVTRIRNKVREKMGLPKRKGGAPKKPNRPDG